MKQSDLRLSAQRAMIGRIYPSMRLVKVKVLGSTINLTVVVAEEPGEQLREQISEAAAEIIADFPEAEKIVETIEVLQDVIPVEDILQEGWIFRRAEDGPP